MENSEDALPLPSTQRIQLEGKSIEEAQTQSLLSSEATPFSKTVLEKKLNDPLTGLETNRPIPKNVAGYQIISCLGEGGMGTVFLAEHTGLRKKVALKIISTTIINSETISRFIREARTLAKLEHPNIVQVQDVGNDNGQYYLVMQYIEGTTLRRKILQNELSNTEKLNILLQVSEAIAFAHKKQIIHRDIKADNVLISSNGEVKLADFGLAKLFMEDSKGSQLTVAGQILGTPDYLAPEISLGKPADTLSDLYALGILFYFTMTGTLPFKAENLANLLLKHVNEIPASPQTHAPEISEDLNYLILKMLQKFPEERYPSVEAMLVDFRLIVSGSLLEKKKLAWDRKENSNPQKRTNKSKIRLFFLCSGVAFGLFCFWWHFFSSPINPVEILQKKQQEFIDTMPIKDTSIEVLAQQILETEKPSQEVLIQLLKKDLLSFPKEKKFFWIRVLGKLQKEAISCVPEIAVCLSDSDEDIAQFAAEALTWIGNGDAITHLLTLHQHPLGYLRQTSAWAAGKRNQKENINILKKLLQDPLEEVQFQSIISLGELGSLAVEVKPDLIEKLNQTSQIKLLQALSRTILQIGLDPREPIAPFLKALQYPDETLQGNLLFALGVIGRRAQKAVPQIKLFLTSKNNVLYVNAKTALIKIGDPETIAIPSLIQDLNSSSPDIQETAAECLGRHGKAAQSAIPALEKLLKSEHMRVRYFADQALQKIRE